jgi:hypothetical protein
MISDAIALKASWKNLFGCLENTALGKTVTAKVTSRSYLQASPLFQDSPELLNS